MGAILHVKSNAVGDFTGTVTVFDSRASTVTKAATDLVRPLDWNSAHAFAQTISGNTAGQSTASGTNLVLGGTNGVGLSLSTAANAATLWVQLAPSGSYHRPADGSVAVNALMNGSLWVMPLNDNDLLCDRLLRYVSVSQSSSSNSSYAIGLTVNAALYTRNAGTLSRLHSGSSLYQWTVTSNNSTQDQAGIRLVSAPLSATVDQQMWLAMNMRSSTTGANWATLTELVVSQLNSAYSGHLASVSNASAQMVLGFGTYSATTAAMPASIAFSDIRQAGAALWRSSPYVALQSGTA